MPSPAHRLKSSTGGTSFYSTIRVRVDRVIQIDLKSHFIEEVYSLSLISKVIQREMGHSHRPGVPSVAPDLSYTVSYIIRAISAA